MLSTVYKLYEWQTPLWDDCTAAFSHPSSLPLCLQAVDISYTSFKRTCSQLMWAPYIEVINYLQNLQANENVCVDRCQESFLWTVNKSAERGNNCCHPLFMSYLSLRSNCEDDWHLCTFPLWIFITNITPITCMWRCVCVCVCFGKCVDSCIPSTIESVREVRQWDNCITLFQAFDTNGKSMGSKWTPALDFSEVTVIFW